MTKGERVAFSYGRSSCVSGTLMAPAYDGRMRSLVSESRAERGIRSNMRNMAAWYIGYACQAAVAGRGITQEQLTQQIHVNRSSVTRQLAFLEENGFITRKRCETDRRTIEVYPTEKMTAAFPIVQQVLKDWKNALTEGLSPQEKEQIEVLTEHLARRAKELV